MSFNRRSVLKTAGAATAASLLPGTGAAASASRIDDQLDTDEDAVQEVIINFDSRPDADRLRHLDLAEGYYKFEALPMAYTKLTGTQIAEVGGWPEVRYVEANRELEWHNDDARDVTGAAEVQNQLGYTGESVHAVVIDTGIDGNHPDHQKNLKHNYRFVKPLDRETMWVDVGPVDTGGLGHGTHVSGSVAGDGSASKGDGNDVDYRGMAPDADLTVYSTHAGAFLLNVVGAYDDMIERQRAGKTNVQVVNNSYGSTNGNDYNPEGALETATWDAFQEGILSSFSAGNAGPEKNTMSDYAAGPHVLSSPATFDDRTVTDFSSRGRDKQTYEGGGEGAQHDRQESFQNLETYYSTTFDDEPVVSTGMFSGGVGPGVQPAGVGQSAYHEFVAPSNAGYVEATLSWTPPGQDLDFYLHEGSKDGPEVASGASLQNPENLAGQIEPGVTYFFEVEPFANVASSYTINYTTYEPPEQIPSGPYGIYRPSVGTPGNFVISTFAPDDPLKAYPTLFLAFEEQVKQADLIYYGRLSGTSMSSPVLTGLAALLFDAHKQETGEFPDPMDVIQALEGTADFLPDLKGRGSSHTIYNIGKGFVDADAAVEELLAQSSAGENTGNGDGNEDGGDDAEDSPGNSDEHREDDDRGDNRDDGGDGEGGEHGEDDEDHGEDDEHREGDDGGDNRDDRGENGDERRRPATFLSTERDLEAF